MPDVLLDALEVAMATIHEDLHIFGIDAFGEGEHPTRIGTSDSHGFALLLVRTILGIPHGIADVEILTDLDADEKDVLHALFVAPTSEPLLEYRFHIFSFRVLWFIGLREI